MGLVNLPFVVPTARAGVLALIAVSCGSAVDPRAQFETDYSGTYNLRLTELVYDGF